MVWRQQPEEFFDVAVIDADGTMVETTGEGETEINRLFYRLGWTKGWYKGPLKDKRFGEIAGDAPPVWKTIKTKLLEMGRKYDQAA